MQVVYIIAMISRVINCTNVVPFFSFTGYGYVGWKQGMTENRIYNNGRKLTVAKLNIFHFCIFLTEKEVLVRHRWSRFLLKSCAIQQNGPSYQVSFSEVTAKSLVVKF